jgi:hypothetical protein
MTGDKEKTPLETITLVARWPHPKMRKLEEVVREHFSKGGM